MSLLKEITDKGATTYWSPVKAPQPLIAVGSKDGASGETFDDYGGELAVYALDLKNSGAQPQLLGKCDTATRFNCLAWGSKGPSGQGIIAGGMQNGVINMWDPKSLGSPLAKIEKHKSQVNSLQFNPHPGTEHLMATGASDNEVYIVDLNNPSKPTVYSPAGPGTQKHTAEVRSVAWNTEVVHVLATAALDGACTVWSLKAKKPWAEIRDPSGAGFSSIAWSPAQGLHLLTASNDDRDPVLRLWDVRRSTTTPMAEYRGHRAGVFSVSWCPHDPSFVISCAKDNKTYLWDLYSGQPVFELSSGSAVQSSDAGLGSLNSYSGNASAAFGMNDMSAGFGAGGGMANNVFGGQNGGGIVGGNSGRRYQVQFCPHERSVISTCSFDRKVEIFSLHGAGGGKTCAQRAASSNPPQTMRAPTWLRRKGGASFGFGGHLVSFGSPAADQAGNPKAGPHQGVVRCSSVCDDEAFVKDCVDFDQQLTNAMGADLQGQQGLTDQVDATALWGNMLNLCAEKAAVAKSKADAESWNFMKLLFEPELRDKIPQQLGFNLEAIQGLVRSLDKRAAAQAEADALAAQQAQAEAEQYAQQQQEQYMNQQSQYGMDPMNPMNPGMDPMNPMNPGPQVMQQQPQFGAPSQMFGMMNGDDSGSALNAFDEIPEQAPPPEENAGQASDQYVESESAPPESAKEQQEEEESTASSSPAMATAAATAVLGTGSKSLHDVVLEDVETKDAQVDSVLGKALLIGNFHVAVDVCMDHNRFADALLLASCGGGDLWNETLQKYFERFYAKKPYIPILAAVIQSDMETYVRKAEISGDSWKEVLAVVSHYGKSEHVPGLFEIIAGRLESERGDEQGIIAACFCYMCARNVDKTVKIFLQQGLADLRGEGSRTKALLAKSIVEKTSVYKMALSDSPEASAMMSVPDVMEQYINLADMLASQGLLEYAAKYLSAVDMNVVQGNVQTMYDANGNVVEVAHLSPEDAAHNEQVDRARLLADRIWGAHHNAEYTLSSFLSGPIAAFEVQNIGVAPTNTPQDPAQPDGMNYGGMDHMSNSPYPNPAAAMPGAGVGGPVHYSPQPNNYVPPPTPQPTPQAPLQSFSSSGSFGGAGAYVPPATPTPSMPMAGPARVPTAPSGTRNTYVKENDGFGTTVGNPSAGEKYGNLPPGGHLQPAPVNVPATNANVTNVWDPNNARPSTTPQPAVQAPAAPTPVQRVMPPAMAPVMQMLDQHMQRLGAKCSPAEKKRFSEVSKSVNALRERLMTGLVPQDLFQEIQQLVGCLVNGDVTGAGHIRQALCSRTQVWTEQKDWLKGMTALVSLTASHP